MYLAVQICFTLIVTAFMLASSYRVLHILQLESYRQKGFVDFLKRTNFDYAARYFAYAFFAFTSMFVYVMCLGDRRYVDLIGFAFFVVISTVFVVSIKKENKKVPLKFTPRIIRLMCTSAVIFAALSFVSIYFTFDTVVSYSLSGLMPLTVIPVVMLALFINAPIEKIISNKFKVAATKKLASSDVTVIGITGSYGKTTAKNILAAMLCQKYTVLSSPKSFNTPMGIAKTVNDDLNGQQVFIAEMGARFEGDIAELVRMTSPRYGLITSIGDQHLESFGCVDKIIKTKFEMAGVKETLLLNGDEENVRNGAKLYGKQDMVFTGKEGFVSYKDEVFGKNGVQFTLVTPMGEVRLTSSLLGSYVPSLVALCAAVAVKMGLSNEEISAAVANLKPIEHRLQLIENERAIIIDDAYNGNPKGAEAALETLSRFDGTKVIITPGLVELGKRQSEFNMDFGEKIARVCDVAILIGANSKDMAAGIKRAESDCKVYSFAFLSEGMKCYSELNLSSPVVLFENDLPDNF